MLRVLYQEEGMARFDEPKYPDNGLVQRINKNAIPPKHSNENRSR